MWLNSRVKRTHSRREEYEDQLTQLKMEVCKSIEHQKTLKFTNLKGSEQKFGNLEQMYSLAES